MVTPSSPALANFSGGLDATKGVTAGLVQMVLTGQEAATKDIPAAEIRVGALARHIDTGLHIFALQRERTKDGCRFRAIHCLVVIVG